MQHDELCQKLSSDIVVLSQRFQAPPMASIQDAISKSKSVDIVQTHFLGPWSFDLSAFYIVRKRRLSHLPIHT